MTRVLWRIFPALFLSVALAFFAGMESRESLPISLLLLSLAIASLFPVYRIATAFTRSVNRMNNHVNKVLVGDTVSRLETSHDDSVEFRQLAFALNSISSHLTRRANKIRSKRDQQKAVLRSMAEGVVAVDMDERIKFINESAAEILKIDHDPNDIIQSTKGRSIQELIRVPEVLKFVKRALESNTRLEREITIERDKRYILQLHSSPLRSVQDREINGVVIVFNDITRVRSLEQHRREFVSNVSHELRTPMTTIQGYSETLAELDEVKSSADANKFAQTILKSSQRLSQILDDLLDLSRMEQEDSDTTLSRKFSNIRPLLEKAAVQCSEHSQEKGVPIEVVCDPKIGTEINSQLMEQAIVNLIENALKYAGEKGKIQLSAQKLKEDVVISVRDDGPGIAANHLDRIFERFYRTDSGRTRKAGGSGLGLAIVKHIAQAHGGSVDAKSQVGEGSEFFIKLPHRAPSN